MSYFPYGSHQIYYESHGSGRPLILLHGNTASSRMFDPIIPMLAEKYRVITLDFLGCGRSDHLPSWPSDLWYDWANQVRALCEHLGLSEVYLAGTSGGALAAINAALEYPQLVRAAAADSFAGIHADPAVTKDIQVGRAQAKHIEGFRAYLRFLHGEDWEQVFDADTDTIVRHAREIGAYFHHPLSELQVPLLLTGSEEDEMFPPGHYQRLFQAICQETSRAEKHIFPHGGHPAVMSSKEAYAALLDRLIEYAQTKGMQQDMNFSR